MAKARIHQQSAAASNVAANEAQVANARAQLAEAETRLGYTKIYAPVSGTVSVRATRQGEVVNPGDAHRHHHRLRRYLGARAAPETEGRFIAVGDKFQVRLPQGKPIEGTVIFKAVEGDYATQRDVSRRKRDIKTIGLKLKVDNPKGELVPGMTAEVLLPKDLHAEFAMSWTHPQAKADAKASLPAATPSWSITSPRSMATSRRSMTFRSAVKQGEIFGLLGPERRRQVDAHPHDDHAAAHH